MADPYDDLMRKRVRIAYKDGDKVLFTHAQLRSISPPLVVFNSEHTNGVVAIPLASLIKIECAP
jgi:hypothetical protein